MHRTAAGESNSEATACLGDPRGLDPGFGDTGGSGPHLALLLGVTLTVGKSLHCLDLNVDVGLKVTKDTCFFCCWL